MRRILYLILLLLLCSCEIFELRDSEEPVKPASWIEPCIDWEDTISNISNAYADLRNSNRYEDLFTEDFRFYFAAQDINDYNINVLWNRTDEKNALYDLHNWSSSMSLESGTLSQNDVIGENEVKIYRSYVLHAFRNSVELQYHGNMEMHLRRENGIWKIKAWYDVRNSQNPTWGKLKYDISI